MKPASLHQTRLITDPAVKLPKIVLYTSDRETPSILLPCQASASHPSVTELWLPRVWAEGFPPQILIHNSCAGFKLMVCGAVTPMGREKSCSERRLQSCTVLSLFLVLIYKGSLILTYFNSH